MTLGRKKGQTREQTRCSHFPIMPPRLTTPEEQTELRNIWTFSWVFWNVLRKSRHLWSCPHEASLTHDTKPSRSVKNVNISLGVYWKLKCSLFATIKKQKNISGPKLATVDVSEGAAGSPQPQEASPLKVLSCASSNKMRFLEILRCFRDVLGVPKKVT